MKPLSHVLYAISLSCCPRPYVAVVPAARPGLPLVIHTWFGFILIPLLRLRGGSVQSLAMTGVLGTIVALTAVLFRYYRVRYRISGMVAMMCAMAIGMVASLVTGLTATMLGAALLPATVGAVILGVGLGAVVGAPVSSLAALDGVLAGLMGGLMGPMVAAMFDRDALVSLLGLVGWSGIAVASLVDRLLREEA